MMGRLLHVLNKTNNKDEVTLDVSSFLPGAYGVVIKSNVGTVRKKFIKEQLCAIVIILLYRYVFIIHRHFFTSHRIFQLERR